MRSSKLINKRQDDGLTLYERVNEFIANKGDIFILPYLTNQEKEKFGQVCTSWQSLVSAFSMFSLIIKSIKEVNEEHLKKK